MEGVWASCPRNTFLEKTVKELSNLLDHPEADGEMRRKTLNFYSKLPPYSTVKEEIKNRNHDLHKNWNRKYIRNEIRCLLLYVLKVYTCTY